VNNVQNRNKISTTSASGASQQWQHNPQHRQGTQYRDTATQQQFNKGNAPNASSRDAYRGRTSTGGAIGQLGAGASGTRASGLGSQGSGQRGSQGGAFEGAGQAHNTSQISQRGQSSMSSARASGFGGAQASRGGGRR